MKKVFGLVLMLTLVMCLSAVTLADTRNVDDDDIAYPVEGGNIYFDKATGMITGADEPSSYYDYSTRSYVENKGVTAADIPVSIEGTAVKKIGNYSFYECRCLESITLPDSIIQIDYNAFYNCTSLKEIDIPEGVEFINPHTFQNCTSLAQVTFPKHLKEIENNAFCGCTSLNNISIPDSVEYISQFAFSGCTSLTDIVIPDGVGAIDTAMFSGCTSLTHITIPDNFVNIWSDAFSGCTSLTEITFPDKLQYIGDGAFSGCTSLKSVIIPIGVKEIKDRTFSGCTSLTDVFIPTGVTEIGDEAFSGCTSLTEITVPYGVKTVGTYAFSECSSAKTITFPEGVTEIGWYCFFGTDALTDIYFFGTEEQWNEVTGKVNLGRDMTGVTVHFKETFADAAPDGYFTDAVEWAAAYDLADPESDTSFGAETPCPRGEVVDIIWRAMGSPKPASNVSPFTDVTADNEYYDAILWAAEKGVTNGRGDGTFGVGDTVTRAQAATFLYRAAGEPEVSDWWNSFNDIEKGQYYYSPVLWAVNRQITKGTGDNEFSPEMLISRGQLITFVYRWVVGPGENK